MRGADEAGGDDRDRSLAKRDLDAVGACARHQAAESRGPGAGYGSRSHRCASSAAAERAYAVKTAIRERPDADTIPGIEPVDQGDEGLHARVGLGIDVDAHLGPAQQQLLEAVVATGKPVVVVLTSGRPYNIGGLEEKVAALVMAFAGGQEGGNALVDVLTGRTEPSGRLTVSVPKNVGAMPYYYNHKMKSAGTPIAMHFGSRYPFGHGLGYTRFEWKCNRLNAPSRRAAVFSAPATEPAPGSESAYAANRSPAASAGR